jgi:hypothetical protein
MVACTITDPTLGLTRTSTDTLTYYSVTTNAQLKKMVDCITIEYLWVNACSDCTQEVWSQLKLEHLTSNTPPSGYSLDFYKTSGIRNMAGLSKLTGALPGTVVFVHNPDLTSLAGLEGLSSMGTFITPDITGRGIQFQISDNPVLVSVEALSNANYRDWTHFVVQNNSKLTCVPDYWPAHDSQTPPNTITHGDCPIEADSSAGSSSSIVIAVVVMSLVFVAGLIFVMFRRRQSSQKLNASGLNEPLLEVEMGAPPFSAPPRLSSQASLASISGPSSQPVRSEELRELAASKEVAYDFLVAATDSWRTELGQGTHAIQHFVPLYM